MFALNPQFEKDAFFVADLELCRVLLMNNSLFPWVILIPRVEKAAEIIDLSDYERHLLMDEICFASDVMRAEFSPYKLNVATLGNQVRQLHIHVIARFEGDPAWPDPVWGKGREPYASPKPLLDKLHEAFSR